MNDHNYILGIIDTLRDGWYTSPINYYYHRKKLDFEYQSYRRTAIEEIKQYLIEHKDQNPVDTIEDFRYQMDIFACNAKGDYANFMFSIYYDVATDILDVLLNYNKEDIIC